jgi:hypothetical protein
VQTAGELNDRHGVVELSCVQALCLRLRGGSAGVRRRSGRGRKRQRGRGLLCGGAKRVRVFTFPLSLKLK